MNTYAAAIDMGVKGTRSTIRTRRSNRFKKLPRMFGRHQLSEYWIFRGANIDVNPGDVVIVLGDSDLLPTTFMRCLCDLLPADEGIVKAESRSILVPPPRNKAIKLLSVRQAVYMLAGLSGMTDREVAERFEAIVDMAGVRGILHETIDDSPPDVKQKIAFSIAMAAPADLVALDRTAIVGDPDFKSKCIPRLETARDRGQSLVIATKNPGLIEAMGSKAIILGDTHSRAVSSTEAVEYVKSAKAAQRNLRKRRPRADGSGEVGHNGT